MSDSTAVSVHAMPHNPATEHSQKGANTYYPDSAVAAAAAAAAAAGAIKQWGGDSNQNHHSNGNIANIDTSCNSPPDTPLAKIIQQQGNSLPNQPTPPQSASHGLAQGGADAWRSYPNTYQQGIQMSSSYTNAPFASPISAGIPVGIDGGSFDHAAAAAAASAGDYYNGAHNVQHHSQGPQHHGYQQLSHPGTTPGAMVPTSVSHQSNGIADMSHLHYQGQGQSAQQHPDQSHPHSQHGQHQHQHQSQFQQGNIHQDPSVAQFDHAAAAAATATSNGAYMSDFGHGMYAGAPEIVSAPATTTHLPPIDPTNGLTRQHSYFGMPTAPSPGTFDSMSATAAAAMANGTGHYSPHPGGPGHYLAAAARGQPPYPSPMIMGRFGLGMPPTGAPGTVSASSPMSVMGPGSMSAPGTPVRPVGMPRMNSHNQSSTSQRKRYLCTVCQKMFARPSTLSTHMHSHTGEKPYECTWDSCGKRFSVMSNLRRHQRIHERQRAKFANIQQQQQQQQQQQKQQSSHSNDSDSSGSTTPLASQMLHTVGSPVAQLGHHMLPPPPPTHFIQQSGMANPGSALEIQSPLGQHHHLMPHPGQQQQQQQQFRDQQQLHHYQQHHHQYHNQYPNHHQPHIHQPQPQHHHHQVPPMALHAAAAAAAVGANGAQDEIPDVSSLSVAAVAAAAAMSESMVPPGTSTSSSTINPTTPQSTFKE
ncbi:hypothetical protein GGI15_003209 [Coemansia interrupta]|uniref:C2H2-type domain-containing protein n=1 Tax=Coemansia interrupta TaxID=1126814 RepID=A0A9W8HDK0_9FUNG|nr:hypothetical protein GGI15_003209 [Coemansia interrupta]